MPRRKDKKPHRGGQLGLIMLVCLLAATSCVAVAEQADSGFDAFLPAGLAMTRDGPPAELPAQQITEDVQAPKATFIVKFEPNAVLKEISQSFRRDQAGARMKFKTWAETYPALQGLQLLRASYSGNLVLALPGDGADRTPGEVIADLNAMDTCIYAELDEIAMPGKEE